MFVISGIKYRVDIEVIKSVEDALIRYVFVNLKIQKKRT